MRLIKLKKIVLAAFGAAMGGLGGLLVILPMAGAIQAPAPGTLPTTAPRSFPASSTRSAALAGELSPADADLVLELARQVQGQFPDS